MKTLLITMTLLSFPLAHAACISVDLLAEDVECSDTGCATPQGVAKTYAVKLDEKGRGILEHSQMIEGMKRVTIVHLKKFEEAFKIDIENSYVATPENLNISTKRNLVDDLTRFETFRMTGLPTAIKEKTYQTMIELSPATSNKCPR
jgi:hypothetical protein